MRPPNALVLAPLLLRGEARTVADLAEATGLSRPSVLASLRRYRSRGLAEARIASGVGILWSATPRGLATPLEGWTPRGGRRGPVGLGRSLLDVLRAARGGRTSAELGAALQERPTDVAGALGRLVDRGLVRHHRGRWWPEPVGPEDRWMGPDLDADDWLDWASRFSAAEAQAVVDRHAVRSPMAAVLGAVRLSASGRAEDALLRLELLAAPVPTHVTVPVWQVWDIPDLERVVVGMHVYAALHEASELLESEGTLAWDPHVRGDVVPFAVVMHRVGARYWAHAADW